MIRTNNSKECCGCKTCSMVCPQSCISYREDIIGSILPVVDKEQCISCGACERVCPIQKQFETRIIGKYAYAAYSNNSKVRFRGSSGGMFETISEWILENNGVVFASKFNADLTLQCFEAATINEVKSLTKSKYLQSDCAQSFPLIHQRLKEGKKVLFCGTPCQVSALKKFIGNVKDTENLFLLDFFCHGVPSQSFFDKCINYIERAKRIKVMAYEFRTKKKNGATPHYYTIEFIRNGRANNKTELYFKDPFYYAFQKYISLRDSCYVCPYAEGSHEADITIGDFHEIDRYVKGINRFDGVSTVLINTEKGNKVWNAINKSLTFHEFDIQYLYDHGIIYAGATKEPQERILFLQDLQTLDFDEVVKRWLDSRKEWKREIYYSLPNVVRKIVKRIVNKREV